MELILQSKLVVNPKSFYSMQPYKTSLKIAWWGKNFEQQGTLNNRMTSLFDNKKIYDNIILKSYIEK